MRTVEDIKAKISASIEDYGESLMVGMSEGIHPLQYYVPDFFKDEFKDKVLPLTREAIIGDMREYMKFALKKARDERGLSASRSAWKYKQWLWVLEDDEFNSDLDNYQDYGLGVLRAINKKYSLITEA